MRLSLLLRGAAVLLVVLAGTAPVAALDDLTADPARIEEMTYDLCTFERALGSEERTAAATYIATAMEERGLSVRTGRFSYSNCYFDPPLALSSNIIGVREGASDRIVIISAHYDTAVPETPGADDNAAGVATMLEVAGILNDTPLNHTVYFIAFSGEETGLEGSTRWLADNPDLHDRIVAAINLDCIASGDRLLASTLPQHRWILGALPPSACIEETPEQLLDAARGDEHAFRAAGIPALRLYERDSHAIIHTADDRPERLNYTLAAECARIVAGTIVGIDTAGEAPEVDLRIEDGKVVFRTSEDTPVEVLVDGTSLGVLPSGSVTLPGGPHVVQVVTYGPTGAKAVATVMGEGVEIVPPAASGNAVTIPWGADPGEDPMIHLTFAAVPLSYRLDRPEEVVRVDGYFDGILIRDLEDGHAIIPTPGPHSFAVVAHGPDDAVLGADRADFSISSYGMVDLDGGILQVDEPGGVTCSASAHTYTYNYTPGERYHITVGCDYRDTADAFLQTAEFRVEGPGDLKSDRRFFDVPVLNDSRREEIGFWLEPEGPGTYNWTIFSSEGDREATGTGSLVLR
ncbi:M28 family metallopeptidase [Methanoculleus chikugoensis]|uniref:M28 family metallopeptidase n=1 Tax=Methanoculleus chikugoensis TaxID=118126 RepID=UPI0009FA6CA4|nr:M28 family metallopeptidase [Methanoculleus chikugoensis]